MSDSTPTSADLRAMARRALDARANRDPRWVHLIVRMAAATDIPAGRIASFIERLAAN